MQLENKYFYSGFLVIIFFLVYNLILAFGSLEGSPKQHTGNGFFPYLNEKPLTEDGFYMLTVSWNIAAGKGIVYNYDIKTTGVQPLAAFLYAVPAYFVQSFKGDKYTFIRAVIIFSALLQVIFAFFIYWIAISISKTPNKGLYFLLSMCVVLLNFKVLLNFENGLETGLYLILLSAFFLYWIKNKSLQAGIKHILGMGLLSGLLVLCRLDAIIILFFFYAGLLITHRIRIGQLLLILTIAFVLYLPWQMYIWAVTDNLFQSSVRSQTTLSGFIDTYYKMQQYFVSIINHLTPFLYSGNIRLWLMFPLGFIYIILFGIGYKNYRKHLIDKSIENIFIIMSISFLALLILYFFFSAAPYFYFRYTAVIMILSFPIFVVLFSHIINKFNKLFRSITLLLPLLIFIVQAILYLHSGKSAVAFVVRPEFVKNNFSDQTRVAAFQTGVLGYYCSNVYNLDGKMDNSALRYNMNNNIGAYLDSLNIKVVLEWKDFIPVLFDQKYLADNWDVYTEDIGDGRTICYVRKKFISK